MIRKLLVSLAVLSLVAGTSLSADPIGLSVGIDDFWFGDVAQDGYKFAGKSPDSVKPAGQAGIAPFVSFEKALNQLTLFAELKYKRGFRNPSASSLDPTVRFTYAVTPELNVWVHDHLVIAEKNGKWAKDSAGDTYIENKAELGLRYTLGLDFGDLYFQAEPGVYTGGKSLLIGALADNDGVQIGVEKVAGGLYGFVRPILQFYAKDHNGDKVKNLDVLPRLDIRVGYEIGPLDARVTVEIPTGSEKDSGNIATNGLTIQPRVTYTIIEGLSAYADVALGNIAADKDKSGVNHVSVSPAIGVSYSF
ncbi:hypothetical protein ACYULU_10040 [Breznakiellaceae bacterium SP9]